MQIEGYCFVRVDADVVDRLLRRIRAVQLGTGKRGTPDRRNFAVLAYQSEGDASRRVRENEQAMPVANEFLAAFAAFCLSTSAPGSPRVVPFTVRVNIEFDCAIRSPIVERIVEDEAAKIWSAYGVELLWSDNPPEATMDLDVIVTAPDRDVPLPVGVLAQLGKTTINAEGVVQGPIRIAFGPIKSIVNHQPDSGALVRDRELGRALGRVLAHEIGHALLGYPAYHDRLGLMRAELPLRDLASADRTGVQLSDMSAERLRDRLGRLFEAQKRRAATRWHSARGAFDRASGRPTG